MLKQVLLNTGYFVDNSYLDEYLELVQKPFSFSGYSEKHHVIPAVVYKVKHGIKDNRKARKLAAKDEGNFLVTLLFKDHCKAHWLLYNCTQGEVKACNARAYIWMTGKKLKETEELSEQEYNLLQQQRDCVMEEDDYYWTQEEKQFLYDHYATAPFEVLTKKLNRRKQTIIRAATLLGLERPTDYYWTPEAEQWLIENHCKYTRVECATYLGTTEASIHKKAKTLGLRRPSTKWTEDEDAWLCANYPVLSLDACSEYLDRSYNAVIARLRKLGITINERMNRSKMLTGQSIKHRWTKEEEQWLLANYSEYGIVGCAEKLGTTQSAVEHKINRLRNI